MAITHLLEDFSSANAAGDVMNLMSEDALEDLRLESFEKGYSAGWEDALAAQEKDHMRFAGLLADSLQDMSFTYQEALTELMGSVQPVFRSLVDVVLPAVMAQTLGEHIVEQLCEMVRAQTSGPASLVVPAGVGASLSPLLTRDLPMPVEITEDPQLDAGRAFLRLGKSEREIDANALLESIRESLDAFSYQTNEDLKNG